MLYLLVASVVWAFSFGLIKHKLVALGLDPFLISFARLALSFLVFLPFLKLRNLNERTIRRLVLIGAIQYGVMYVAYMWSFPYLQAHEVALFTIFTPLFVTAINDLASRRVHRTFAAMALLSVLGAGVIAWSGHALKSRLFGFLLIQVSNLSFAFGQVRYKRMLKELPDVKDHQIFALLYFGGVLFAAVPAFVTTDWSAINLTSEQMMTLLYLGVIPSGLCFFLWNMGARRTNTGTLAVMNNAKIPLAVACSLVCFHESAHVPLLVLGGSVIAASVVVNEYFVRKRRP